LPLCLVASQGALRGRAVASPLATSLDLVFAFAHTATPPSPLSARRNSRAAPRRLASAPSPTGPSAPRPASARPVRVLRRRAAGRRARGPAR
jgi:hypothetical protein